MKPEDVVYNKVAKREVDPKIGDAQYTLWHKAGLYVTLACARISHIGPMR